MDSNRDWRACNGEMRIKIHLEVLGSAEVDDISSVDSGADGVEQLATWDLGCYLHSRESIFHHQ